MRLARFAASGLALGIVAGFAVAFLRPRRRLVTDQLGDWVNEGPGAHSGMQGPARSFIDATGGSIGWGTRRPKDARRPKEHLEPLPPLVPVVPARVRGTDDDGSVAR